jgi:hypothetical protein
LAVTLVSAVLVTPTTVRADNGTDQAGFTYNFRGNIIGRYTFVATPGSPAVTIILPPPPLVLKDKFDQVWATQSGVQPGGDGQPSLCHKIKDVVNKSGVPVARWNSCVVPGSGELRAKIDGPNTIALRYIVSNVQFSFDVGTSTVFGKYADPSINGSFDIVIDEKLRVLTSIDTDPAYQPASRTVTQLVGRTTIANAHIWSAHVAVPDELLRKSEQTMNRTPLPPPDDETEGMNALLVDTVKQLPRNDQGANQFFDLEVKTEGTAIALRFIRDLAVPGAPQSCGVDHHTCFTVVFKCATEFGWVEEPTAPGYQNISWTYVIGTRNDYANRTAEVPLERGIQQYRICAGNRFGKNCTPPIDAETYPEGDKPTCPKVVGGRTGGITTCPRGERMCNGRCIKGVCRRVE